MAKISTYVIDGTIVDGDKVIGSDANNDMITKNYTVGDLVNYFAASIGGNFLVPYVGANDDVDLGSFNLSANSIFIGDLVYLGGSAGNPGEVLTSQGTGGPAYWSTVVGSQDLLSVLNYGNLGNKSITLDNLSATISLDIDNIYDSANVTIIDKTNSNTSRFLGNELYLQDSSLQKDVSYFSDSIVYRDLALADTVTVKPAAYNNQTFLYPYIGGALVVSVNGVYADMSGNVALPSSGVTGTGTTTYIPKWSTSTALSNSSMFDNGTAMGIGYLAGSGTRMVVADASGTLSTQTIPSSTGGVSHGTASGTDTYTTTISGVTSYADGDAYLIRFTNGNTTGCTLNINGLGARTLYRNNDGALIGGDIVDGGEMLCVYNSTLSGFQVIGTAPNTLLGYVTNGESITITKGQAVYAFSGTGDRMVVKLAYNTGDSTSAQTVGIVLSTSIGANQKGLIIMQGLLDGLSILKPVDGWADGDPVYLGATAGTLTKVKPYAPNHLVYLGVVTTSSPGAAGRMYVRVQNGYELDELHNVQAQTPSVNDVLYYFGGSPGQWKTASISTVLGYTPLSTIGSGTTNYLAKWNGTNTLTGSVIYDTGTNVIIGSNTDAGYKLDVVGGNTRLGTTTSNTLTIGNGMLFDYSSSRSRIYSNNSIIFTSALATGSKIITGVIGGSSNTTGSVEFESAFGDISQTSGTYIDLSLSGRLLHTSGTSTYNFLSISPTLQTSVGGTYTGTVRGFYYNPTTVNAFGGTNIAFENTIGDIVHGNLSGVGTRMVTADSTGKLGVQAIPGGGGSPAGSTGYVQFNNAGSFGADAGLFWDNTNKRLGIGTTSPSYNLHVSGNVGAAGAVQSRVINTNSAGEAVFFLNNDTYAGGLELFGSTYGGGLANKMTFTSQTPTGFDIVLYNSSVGADFGIKTTTSLTDRFKLFGNTGNVYIGSSPADSGFKLEVNGTSRLNGNITTGTGSLLTIAGNTFSGLRFVIGGQTTYANGASTNTPLTMAIGNGVGAGVLGYAFDASNSLGLILTAGNGTLHTARASMNVTNLTNTSGSESGDLAFSTQSGGAALAERMRIFAGGNIGIGTATNAGYKLDVNGTARITNGIVVSNSGNAIGSASQFLFGSASTTPQYWRLTNGGADNTAAFAAYTNSISGTLMYNLDRDYGFVLGAANANGNKVARGSIQITNLVNTANSESGDMIFLTQSGGTAMSEKMRITSGGGITYTATNTAAGTTGNQTINKPSGTVNIAASGTSITVTNSLVTASSIVFATIRTNDATAVIKNVVPSSGSFTINLNAAATAETSIGFFVIN